MTPGDDVRAFEAQIRNAREQVYDAKYGMCSVFDALEAAELVLTDLLAYAKLDESIEDIHQ